MACLNDIRNIIKPINHINYELFNKELDNILENIIMNNITIYNSYIFNHIIYNMNNENQGSITHAVMQTIGKYLATFIKNQRTHFRNLNKKNKLDVKDFNNFFDVCYKLINKLNGMFQHIKIINNTNNSNNKWGDSILWSFLITDINQILLNDVVFKYAIINNIKNIPSTEKNPDIYRLYNYMNIFSNYIKYDFGYIDILYDTITELIENDINDTVVDNNTECIYKFKKIYKYYFDYYVNYFYLTKDRPLIKLNNYMTNFIKHIFENNNIMFIKNFINIYKKEFISLSKHIDLCNILLSYPINDINSFISYYYELYDASHNNNLYYIVNECIKENTKKYFKTFEDVLYLADLINTDILNKKTTEFYYLLGYNCNKDEFIMAICQKLMERIIYTYCDNVVELNNFNILQKMFSNSSEKSLVLKYNIIYNDYLSSIKLWNSTYENQNNFKIIITSLDAWKINHSLGYSNTIINNEEFTTTLCSKLFQYNVNNSIIKKKLIIYSHLGCVNIEIYNKQIYVLPAHMFCLELFVSFDTNLSYDYIKNKVKQNMSNYSDEFINRIIDSLIGPILIKNDDNLYRIKTDINDINLIEIFYNTTISSTINEMKEELCHDKIDIIKANINHFIKLTKEINYESLYSLVNDNIKVFNMNKELFTKAIDILIKDDYINFNDDIFRKIEWV